ncbi:hypothetical protein HPB48_004091 [Haemaphysalis longicornis]|uniref:Uncharacterized protein n=1 Tax=Haemaphysalis longicornis TaxID=44386 RepID=A0A9J6FCD7_HAELO|nr:hypothetical protein HPB48_004091 [Haemaphysalis longicornis]
MCIPCYLLLFVTARYTVGIAHTFHTTKQPRLPLRLRGVMLGAGFLGDLLKVADSSDFLYQTSMITKKQHDLFAEQFRDMRKKATGLMGKIGALLMLMRTIFTDKKKPTLFQTLTGYNNHASALYTEKPLNMLKYAQYVQTDEFKRAVHVARRSSSRRPKTADTSPGARLLDRHQRQD